MKLFKKYCMSDGMNGRKAVEGVCEIQDGNCEDSKAEVIGMVNTARLMKLNKGYSLQEGNQFNKFHT
jgi:hypothetical protein